MAAIGAASFVGSTYLAAGTAGIVISGTVIALLALFTARSVIPGPVRSTGTVMEEKRRAELGPADFPSYRDISAELTWAGTSQRHYDHGLRPLLARLVTARLAERHGLDAATQTERAAAVIGADLWPWVDPSRPASSDRDAPGVSLAALTQIVTKLEEL
ncbi:MAG TPA: hypothetical protein VGH27_28395 [Streptosporangiaceae bacterium]|jgi:hypothetical protein